MTEPTMSTDTDPNSVAEGRERSGAAGSGVASVHREDGHLVAAGILQNRQSQCSSSPGLPAPKVRRSPLEASGRPHSFRSCSASAQNGFTRMRTE